MKSLYTFDSNFVNTSSILIKNDTLIYLENIGIESVTFKAIDLKTNQVFKSIAFDGGYSLGLASFDTLYNCYVFPIQQHSLVLQKLDGLTQIVKLKETCKIKPLIYQDLVLFHDRGCCIKTINLESTNTVWTIPTGDFSISQPILEDLNVIILLNNNTLVSIDFVTGKENWRYLSKSGLHIGNIYGSNKEKIFILTTDLKGNIDIEAVDIHNGQLVTQIKLKDSIDVWNLSNVIIGNKMYCKGYDRIFVYDLMTLKKIREYNFKRLLNTNLVKYKNKILFSTEKDKKLFQIENDELKELQSKIEIQDIIVTSDDIYLFSYPALYKVQ